MVSGFWLHLVCGTLNIFGSNLPLFTTCFVGIHIIHNLRRFLVIPILYANQGYDRKCRHRKHFVKPLREPDNQHITVQSHISLIKQSNPEQNASASVQLMC